MNKLLVRLFVPALRRNFDLFVPCDLKIDALTRLIAGGVEELSGGQYATSHEEMLNRREPDMLLDPQKTLHDYGIHDGSQLVLL